LASEEQLNENNERLVLITVTWQTMFLAAALMFNSNFFLALKSTIGNFVAVEFLCWVAWVMVLGRYLLSESVNPMVERIARIGRESILLLIT